MGMVTGKSGKTYWLNLDNLGGYQMGDNGLDAAIQVTQNENSVFAGAGVNPLGGGYVYVLVTTYHFQTSLGSGPSSGSAFFLNNGNMTLNVQNVTYSIVSGKGPWIAPNTTSDRNAQVGPFIFSSVPSTIPVNGQATVGIT